MTEQHEPIDGADETPEYEWLLSKDEHLRAFILKHYGSGAHEIDGRILVSNMDAVFQWIKAGTLPALKSARNVRAVANEGKS